jgi:hypothetical protein
MVFKIPQNICKEIWWGDEDEHITGESIGKRVGSYVFPGVKVVWV